MTLLEFEGGGKKFAVKTDKNGSAQVQGLAEGAYQLGLVPPNGHRYVCTEPEACGGFRIHDRGLSQLTVLTISWLGARGLISAALAVRSRVTRLVTRLLLLRGGTDLLLGLTLFAGLSVTQIARLLFGETAAMSAGFLVIIAASFAVASSGAFGVRKCAGTKSSYTTGR